LRRAINEKYFQKEFILSIILVYALGSIMLAVGINEGIKQSSEQVNATVQEIEQMRQTVTAFDIFTNNVFIALISAVPIAGVLFYLFVSYNTGMVYGAIGKYYGLTELQTMSLAFTNYIGIVETLASCILVAESILIVYLLIKDREEAVERLKNHSWKSLLICVIMLLFGAFVEYWLIKL